MKTPEKILKAVVKLTGVSEDEIFTRSRRVEIVEARQFLWYLLKTDYNMSNSAIARLYGYDPATVLSGIRTFGGYLEVGTKKLCDWLNLYKSMYL